jgi:CheY-like chemotaxis protein
MKILLIEDDELMSRMYMRILEAEGFEVTVVNISSNTIEIATQKQPELILLDIMMPNSDGLEVLTQLKQNPNTSSIPVIMLSNLSTDNVISEAFTKGAQGYLVKSQTSNEELLEQIKKYQSV